MSGSGSTSSASIDAYLGIILPLLFIFCVLVVRYYAEPNFPYFSYFSLTIGYFSAFAIMLLVPLDIGVTVVDRRSTAVGQDPIYNSNHSILAAAYNAFFSLVLIFGSIVLVFEEYYNTDGKPSCLGLP